MMPARFRGSGQLKIQFVSFDSKRVAKQRQQHMNATGSRGGAIENRLQSVQRPGPESHTIAGSKAQPRPHKTQLPRSVANGQNRVLGYRHWFVLGPEDPVHTWAPAHGVPAAAT